MQTNEPDFRFKMKIYVISLADAIQRRKNVEKQLTEADLDFSLFDGLRAKNGFSEYFNGYDEYQYQINTGRKATEGEIGCYASHLALWKLCVDRNQPIMIMEDDFHLKEHFVEAFHEVEKLINEYGYIRLQTERRAKKKLVKQIGKFSLFYYTKMPHSLMCYAISPAIAKQFIAHSQILTAPVDVMIKKIWEHRQRLYGLTPYQVEEDRLSQMTNIHGRVKHRKSTAISLVRFITKIKWALKRRFFTFNFKPG